MSYSAGFSRIDISVYEPDMAMLGYGMPYNRVNGVAVPIFARAMVLRQDDTVIAYLCTEQCFAAPALRTKLIERLQRKHPDRGFTQHNVCWSATHNHSAPNGYCHYTTHLGMNFGFSPLVFETLLERFVAVILAADDALEPAVLSIGSAEIAPDEPVAFNRSLGAWKRNPEAKTSVAVSRTTVTLRVDGADGRAMGLLNWFAVHGTSIHSDNTEIHSDNKGLAAIEVEHRAGDLGFREDFVAI
ncbi:MAG: neutral ceramidase, partial [Myxococcota bacterium]